VTLFGLDGCQAAADLRALFERLGVPFSEITLGQPSTPADCCGYVSPSVQIASGTRKPEFLVQPSRVDVLKALYEVGELSGTQGGGRR
jgi:hypothetical protein